ncbi:hypothetical protein chiPu_0028234, partial [Chiloscyllium punctatum]|nr:hypothetical protein [Chiloscyllium punctatum]
LPEECARRALYRLELLRKVREQVLPHPQLQEHLRLCQAWPELPEWWESGRHDLELLTAVARRGLGRPACHPMDDPQLSFRLCRQRQRQRGGGGGSRSSTPVLPAPGQPPAEAEGTPRSPSQPIARPTPLDWSQEADWDSEKSSSVGSTPASLSEDSDDDEKEDKPACE